MTPERRQRIEEIFRAAQRLDPAGRASYLAESCGPDNDLRQNVETLLLHNTVSDLTATMHSEVQQFGAYRVIGAIGEGGMGTVYLAEDTRLRRKVAIKVGQARYSERFEREARSIAALNHPNICTLYDVGPNYLVMELCEGETLASRIRRGKLSPEEVCRVGAQIAAALAAAHARRIVHRDLKPANVMLTKTGVKVLDFGLAKSDEDPALTVTNAVMGTPAYMSPEQREGQPADHRTDICSLGIVLGEMATGKRSQESIGTELASEPHLAALIARCVENDPAMRWQSAADISHQLAWLSQAMRRPAPATSPAQKRKTHRTAYGFFAALVLLGAGFGLARLFRTAAGSASPAATVQFSLLLNVFAPNGFEAMPRLSPDGRYLAFAGRDDTNINKLWVRSISEANAHALPGTENASDPFWSPDSRWIGYLADGDGKVRKVSPEGGPPQTLFAIATAFQEPQWAGKGEILYHPNNREPLFRISESGGTPVQVTTLDKARTENSHRGLQMLPGGRRFLFVARCADRAMNALYIGSLDTGTTKRLGPMDSIVRFAALPGANRGRIFYHRDGSLVARTLNLATEQLEGEPTVILNSIGYNPTGLATAFNISSDGRTAIWRDSTGDLPRFVWYSRTGERQGELGDPENRIQVRFSPDGARVVYAGVDPQTGNRDLFMMDVARGIPQRLTDNVANEWYPAWSPDSSRIAFVSDRPDGGTFLKAATNAAAAETRIYASAEGTPEDWSRDGHWIAGVNSPGSLWVADAVPGAKPVTILPPSRARNDGIRFSPDTHWIAFVSDESGQPEIYVRKFMGETITPEAIRLTRGGADYPVWNPKGGELFFVTRDLTLWSVDTRNLGNAPPPAPVRLFRLCESGTFTTPVASSTSYSYTYDTPDGKRFLANCTAAPLNRIMVTVNPPFGR
jgi:serine/threonine protein kinase